MSYTIKKGCVIGILPNGDYDIFDSVDDYEDAYYDMMYALNNCFELEWPEDYA